MIKKRAFGWMTAAGCALCAVSAMGAAENVVRDDFESPVTAGTAVSTITGWTGYGTVTASNYTAAVATVGRPIGDGTGANVLVVEGRVQRTAATTSTKPATVDMMVQIATPDDALEFPSGTTTSDIQIAVGVETNATLKVYCKNKDGNPGWYPLGTTYIVGSWHRVSFTFDYANNLCQIRVDGDPILSANGYLTTDTTNLPDENGSWYKLAKADAGQLASVQVIGSTAIDDLLVKQDTAADATVADVLPALADEGSTTTIDSVAVPNNWIEQQGITRTTTVAPDNSGMRVAEKYRTGLSATDGQKFTISSMSMKEANGNKYATLTLPSMTPPSGYVNKVQYKTASGNWADVNVTASGTIDVPVTTGGDSAVIYLRLVNLPASAN